MTACRSFVSRGCRNCCGLKNEGPGHVLVGNGPDEEAGRIWQLKNWDCCHAGDVSLMTDDSGVRLKMFHAIYIVDLILNPHGPQ